MSGSMKWETPDDWVKRRASRRKGNDRSKRRQVEQEDSPSNQNDNNQNEESTGDGNDSDNRAYNDKGDESPNDNQNFNNISYSRDAIKIIKTALLKLLEKIETIDNTNINVSMIAKYIWLGIGVLVIAILVCFQFCMLSLHELYNIQYHLKIVVHVI